MSDRETLTNVLDWQNRNMVFWFERYPLSETTPGPLPIEFKFYVYYDFRAPHS